jgi:hypothetical protein
MTITETANAMRRIADALDNTVAKSGSDPDNGRPKPTFEYSTAVGAAVMLCYLRDLVTIGTRETYDRGTLLVLLETISRDAELFPCGVGAMAWAPDDEEMSEPQGNTREKK